MAAPPEERRAGRREDAPPEKRDVIAIGASAGGMAAIRELLDALPADLPATVVVTLHLSSSMDPVRLPRLLQQAGLPTAYAQEGDRLVPGQVLVAPPDRHLIVDAESVRVRAGPPENRARPAVDAMFRSVACSHRGRAIALVLTGYMDDGASGALPIRRCGGVVIVQDPQDAAVPDMPRNTLAVLDPDHMAPLRAIPALLAELVGSPAGSMEPPTPELALEVRIAAQNETSIEEADRLGQRSGLACPTCHGTLWEVDETRQVRYRCHTGHAFTARALERSQMDEIERALMGAMRALDERSRMLRRLARETRSGYEAANLLEKRAVQATQQANSLRRLLIGGELASEAPVDEAGRPVPKRRPGEGTP